MRSFVFRLRRRSTAWAACRVDLHEISVDRTEALRGLKEVREGVFDFTRNGHPVKAHGLSERHVVNVQAHEGLLDGAERVTLVFGVGEEAREPREVVVREVHGTLHAVVREVSHRKRRALQGKRDGQGIEVPRRDDRTLHTVPFHEIARHLSRFGAVRVVRVENRRRVVIRAVDLDEDLRIKVFERAGALR